MLKIVQRNRDSRLDLMGGSQLQATRMMHTCQACQKLKRHASCCTTGQKSQASQVICSHLELATQPSREVKSPEHPVWENLTFHIPSDLTIYIYPYTHDLERASRENFKRETLAKTKLTHPQSLPKRLFKFLYSFPLHCQIPERSEEQRLNSSHVSQSRMPSSA